MLIESGGRRITLLYVVHRYEDQAEWSVPRHVNVTSTLIQQRPVV